MSRLGPRIREDQTQESSKGNSRRVSPERTEHGGLQERNEIGRLNQTFEHLENNSNRYLDSMAHKKI